MTEEYISIREIARRTSLTYETVWRYIKTGELPSVKIGGSRRILTGEYERWVKERTVNG